MFSRLTAFATAFAILATASLAVAATLQNESHAPVVAIKATRVIQLEPVIVIAKRRP